MIYKRRIDKSDTPPPILKSGKTPKERFKVTMEDRVTGEILTYYAYSSGFQFQLTQIGDKIQAVRMVLDHPRKQGENDGK